MRKQNIVTIVFIWIFLLLPFAGEAGAAVQIGTPGPDNQVVTGTTSNDFQIQLGLGANDLQGLKGLGGNDSALLIGGTGDDGNDMTVMLLVTEY